MVLDGWINKQMITGTWKTYDVRDENDLCVVPDDIPLEAAATIAVNPCTAYRMLHDFTKLKPGSNLKRR